MGDNGLTVHKAAGAVGAFVTDVTLEQLLDDDARFDALLHTAMRHGVVFLRDQAVDAATFQSFGRRFGPAVPHDAYGIVADAPDVQVLESTAETPSKIEVWHSDMTFMESPPSFTLLQGQIIPGYGGDTLWASAAAAYASLSPPMKSLLDGVTAVHDFRHGFKESLAEPGGRERLAPVVAQHPPVSHPVVRTHPATGEKALFVNALFTTRLEGFTELESQELLEFLYRHIVAAEHTVRLQWAPGTIAIWDNRVVQHKPVNDFFPQHRLMRRVTIQGDRPV